MALKANYEFLFVGKDDNSFLENYSYDLFQDFGTKGGQIFLTIEIQNNLADAEEIGKAVFETMKNAFFSNVDADSYERFEVALKEVNKVLDQFRSEKKSGYIGNLSAVIAAIVGDTLYLTQCGDAEAYLIRKRYVSVVSEGLDESGEAADVFTNIANGKIEPGDFVLFSSTRLLRYISKPELARCLSKAHVEKAFEELKDAVSTEILGRIAMTGMLFEEVSEKEVSQSVDKAVDNVTQSVLEASQEQIVAEKESLTGRFFTALKKRKDKGPNIFEGSSRFSSFSGRFKEMFNGFFSRGFGKDKILFLLFVVIVVLAVVIFVVRGNTAEQETLDKLDATLISVQEKIAQAETKSSYDKENAKEILDKAYSDALTVLNSGYYRQKAQGFLVQIEQTRDKLDNVTRIENPTIYADLSAKRADVSARGFAEVSDRVFVYEYNALYELVLDQIQDPITIDEQEQVIAATGFDDRGSVVFLTQSGKLIEYKDGTMSFMDSDEGSFRKASSLDDWGNKIYLLDGTDGKIWKYTFKGTADKFGAGESYLAEGSETDLTNARDISIDSSIYLLKKSGDVLRLYGGTDSGLKIENQPFATFTNPLAVYTNEKLKQVFVLDAGESKVFVYQKDDKTGNLVYQSQYFFDGIKDLRDVYVDSESNKMYVLTTNKIMEVAL